jgi:hypothetical protein
MGCLISCFQDNNIEYKQIEIDNTLENYSDNEEYSDFYEDYYTNYFDTVYRRRFYTYD